MSAERLREAAAEIRRTRLRPPDPHGTHENCSDCQWDRYASAVADLLDREAAKWEIKVKHGGSDRAIWSNQRNALAVADAVLGGESE